MAAIVQFGFWEVAKQNVETAEDRRQVEAAQLITAPPSVSIYTSIISIPEMFQWIGVAQYLSLFFCYMSVSKMRGGGEVLKKLSAIHFVSYSCLCIV